MRLHFGKGLCRLWNQRFQDEPALSTFMLIFMKREIQGPDEAAAEAEPIMLWRHYCFNKDIPKEKDKKKKAKLMLPNLHT